MQWPSPMSNSIFEESHHAMAIPNVANKFLNLLIIIYLSLQTQQNLPMSNYNYKSLRFSSTNNLDQAYHPRPTSTIKCSCSSSNKPLKQKSIQNNGQLFMLRLLEFTPKHSTKDKKHICCHSYRGNNKLEKSCHRTKFRKCECCQNQQNMKPFEQSYKNTRGKTPKIKSKKTKCLVTREKVFTTALSNDDLEYQRKEEQRIWEVRQRKQLLLKEINEDVEDIVKSVSKLKNEE